MKQITLKTDRCDQRHRDTLSIAAIKHNQRINNDDFIKCSAINNHNNLHSSSRNDNNVAQSTDASCCSSAPSSSSSISITTPSSSSATTHNLRIKKCAFLLPSVMLILSNLLAPTLAVVQYENYNNFNDNNLNNTINLNNNNLIDNKSNNHNNNNYNNINNNVNQISPRIEKYSHTWAVHIPNGEENDLADLVAHEHGFKNLGKIFGEYYHFEHSRISKRSVEPSDHHQKRLDDDNRVLWSEQQKVLSRKKRDLIRMRPPRVMTLVDSVQLNDDKWPAMWYLNREDDLNMNVIPAWKKGFTGKGVVVTILDDGLETDHPDLVANYDPLASYDVNSHDNDPMPHYDLTDSNRHGTRCAGEVAATANNTRCAVGIAFGAKVGGVRMLDGDVTDAVEARSLSLHPEHIDIYSASWGPDDDGKTVDGPGEMASRAFIEGVTKGRNGKGSIFVWASGNGGRELDNCNCDGYTNSIWTLSISSATEEGHVPWYSEKCSSTLATTYSSGGQNERQIVTTDLHHSCTVSHTGTSASAPLAAGIVALVLESNRNLTWRDLQHIVVRTAKPANLRDPTWSVNGVGRKVSHSFGYGLMDASGMVDLARKWKTVPDQQRCEINAPHVDKIIPARDSLTLQLTVRHCKMVKFLEHVQAKITLTSQRRGDLQIHLISPAGTRVTLLTQRVHDASRSGFTQWPFMSVHTWGEHPHGDWQLEIQNEGKYMGNALLREWSLIFYGTTLPIDSSDPSSVPITTTTTTSNYENEKFYTTSKKNYFINTSRFLNASNVFMNNSKNNMNRNNNPYNTNNNNNNNNYNNNGNNNNNNSKENKNKKISASVGAKKSNNNNSNNKNKPNSKKLFSNGKKNQALNVFNNNNNSNNSRNNNNNNNSNSKTKVARPKGQQSAKLQMQNNISKLKSLEALHTEDRSRSNDKEKTNKNMKNYRVLMNQPHKTNRNNKNNNNNDSTTNYNESILLKEFLRNSNLEIPFQLFAKYDKIQQFIPEFHPYVGQTTAKKKSDGKLNKPLSKKQSQFYDNISENYKTSIFNNKSDGDRVKLEKKYINKDNITNQNNLNNNPIDNNDNTNNGNTSSSNNENNRTSSSYENAAKNNDDLKENRNPIKINNNISLSNDKNNFNSKSEEIKVTENAQITQWELVFYGTQEPAQPDDIHPTKNPVGRNKEDATKKVDELFTEEIDGSRNVYSKINEVDSDDRTKTECLIFTLNQRCVECRENFFLYNGRCYSQCPNNTFQQFITKQSVRKEPRAFDDTELESLNNYSSVAMTQEKENGWDNTKKSKSLQTSSNSNQIGGGNNNNSNNKMNIKMLRSCYPCDGACLTCNGPGANNCLKCPIGSQILRLTIDRSTCITKMEHSAGRSINQMNRFNVFELGHTYHNLILIALFLLVSVMLILLSIIYYKKLKGFLFNTNEYNGVSYYVLRNDVI